MSINKFKFLSKYIVLTTLCSVFSLSVCSTHSKNTSEFDNRILNGIRAEDYQFPYQVSIQKHKKHICGGSIISEFKVLTAGHCVTDINGRPKPSNEFRILAGTNKLKTRDPKYFYVKSFSVHPKFDRSTIQYDYAVMFIAGNFDFQSNGISKIRLANKDPTPGTVCYLSGWGDVDKSSRTKIPNDLQFAKVTVDPLEVCTRNFGKFFSSTNNMLCAGRRNKENAGSGDSGGPLCCNNELSGIVSFGREYDDSKFPDVYSSVAYVVDWINNARSASKAHTCDSFCHVAMFIALFVTQILFCL